MNRLLLLIQMFVVIAQSGCVSTARVGHETELFDLFDGMSVMFSRDFGGQQSVYLADGIGSDAWMSPSKVKVGIPLLLQFHVDRAPYHLRLEVHDTGKLYQSIEVNEVLLEYKNGECIRKNVDWSQPIEHNEVICQ